MSNRYLDSKNDLITDLNHSESEIELVFFLLRKLYYNYYFFSNSCGLYVMVGWGDVSLAYRKGKMCF